MTDPTDSMQRSIAQYLDGFSDESSIPPVEIFVLGCMGVGKKSLIHRVVWNSRLELPDYCSPFEEGKITLQDRTVRVRWFEQDLDVLSSSPYSDEDRLNDAAKMAPGFNACLLIYDAEWRPSFERLQQFVAAFEQYVLLSERTRPRLFVAMSKVDRDASLRKVSIEEGKSFSDQIEATFLHVSAWDSTGLSKDDIYHIISQTLCEPAAGSQARKRTPSAAEEQLGLDDTRDSSARRNFKSILRFLRLRH